MRGLALASHLRSLPFAERDAAVDAMLGLKELPDDVADLPRGAVPYLPCGVDEILAMVADAPVRAADAFVDVGAGLGRVAILVHLLSKAHASGIEIQAPLVSAARALSARLGLGEREVTFVHGDAATAHLDGTVFFFYAPFGRDILDVVLARLRHVAERHPIVLGTVGFEIHDVPWLRERKSSHVALTLYDAVFPPT